MGTAVFIAGGKLTGNPADVWQKNLAPGMSRFVSYSCSAVDVKLFRIHNIAFHISCGNAESSHKHYSCGSKIGAVAFPLSGEEVIDKILAVRSSAG